MKSSYEMPHTYPGGFSAFSEIVCTLALLQLSISISDTEKSDSAINLFHYCYFNPRR